MSEKTKKMDIDKELHTKICLIQAKIFQKFRIKLRIQDITNECIERGLLFTEHNIEERLNKDSTTSPVK